MRVAARGFTVGAAAAILLVAWQLLPLKSWLADFESWIVGLGPLGALVYVLVYGVATLLFVPGSVLTMGAGYVFGVAWGTVIVLLGASLGAALAFLIARRVARVPIERLARRNRRFASIDRAIEKNGWKVVGLMRLVPVFPFSLSSYFFGLTRVRFFPYLIVSALGIVPGTLVYLSLGAAGKGLGHAGERSPWEWTVAAAGAVALIVAIVILVRLARRELERHEIDE